jgi:hypothetical protein
MSGWDALSDAIKIGVPSLLAYCIARAARSYETKKDLRRQSQQVLEQMVKRIAAVHSVSKKFWLFKSDELFAQRARTPEWLEEKQALLREMDKHAVDIEECRAILLMLNVSASKGMGDFFAAMNNVNLAFDRQPAPAKEEIEDLEGKARLSYVALVISLGAAFRKT